MYLRQIFFPHCVWIGIHKHILSTFYYLNFSEANKISADNIILGFVLHTALMQIPLQLSYFIEHSTCDIDSLIFKVLSYMEMLSFELQV